MNGVHSPIRIDQWLAILLISVMLLTEGAVSAVPVAYLQVKLVPQLMMAASPVMNATPTTSLNTISATAYLVVDAASGAVLAAKIPDAAKYPASTVKMVTALVALQKHQLSDVITLTAADLKERSNAGFQVGDRVSVRALLSALLIQSDNAAADILANHSEGGRALFLEKMRLWSQAHHLQHTVFTDPAGFDSLEQQLSSRDLLIVAKEILQQPTLAEIVSTNWTLIQVQRRGIDVQLPLSSTNKLLFDSVGVLGVKTGTTPLAGEVLVTYAVRQNRGIYVVLMESANRFDETRQLLDWVEQSYSWQLLN